jgi:hypothetical protein
MVINRLLPIIAVLEIASRLPGNTFLSRLPRRCAKTGVAWCFARDRRPAHTVSSIRRAPAAPLWPRRRGRARVEERGTIRSRDEAYTVSDREQSRHTPKSPRYLLRPTTNLYASPATPAFPRHAPAGSRALIFHSPRPTVTRQRPPGSVLGEFAVAEPPPPPGRHWAISPDRRRTAAGAPPGPSAPGALPALPQPGTPRATKGRALPRTTRSGSSPRTTRARRSPRTTRGRHSLPAPGPGALSRSNEPSPALRRALSPAQQIFV